MINNRFNKRFVLHLTIVVSMVVSVVGVLGGGTPLSASAANLKAEVFEPMTPIGSGFTYQGRLAISGSPANGQYDLGFTLWDALSGGTMIGSPLTHLNQTVTNGLFTVQLDFGSGAFVGDGRWLEISVKPAGGPTFTTLTPRQPISAVPYSASLAPGSEVRGNLATSVISSTNSGSGNGVSGSSAGGAGVFGSTTGTGQAGRFDVNNTANGSSALWVSTNGTGRAGRFEINNPSSTSNALSASTTG